MKTADPARRERSASNADAARLAHRDALASTEPGSALAAQHHNHILPAETLHEIAVGKALSACLQRVHRNAEDPLMILQSAGVNAGAPVAEGRIVLRAGKCPVASPVTQPASADVEDQPWASLEQLQSLLTALDIYDEHFQPLCDQMQFAP